MTIVERNSVVGNAILLCAIMYCIQNNYESQNDDLWAELLQNDYCKYFSYLLNEIWSSCENIACQNAIIQCLQGVNLNAFKTETVVGTVYKHEQRH